MDPPLVLCGVPIGDTCYAHDKDAMAAKQKHELYRLEDGVIGGVCAGMADSFDVDIIVPRILAVLITLSTFGIGAIGYLILWVKLPERSLQSVSDPYEIQPDYADVDEQGSAAMRGGFPLFARSSGDGRNSTVSLVVRVAVAVCLAVLFLIVAAMVPPFIPGTQAWQLWPVAFLVVGVFLVIVPIHPKHEMVWHAIGIVITAFAAMALPMSLNLVSWHTVPMAFQALWFLVVAGAIMLIAGIVRSDAVLMIGGAVCIAAFCLFTLVFLAIPPSTPFFVVITDPRTFQLIGG